MNKRQRRKLAKQCGFGYFLVVFMNDAGKLTVNLTPISHKWIVKTGRRVHVRFPEGVDCPANSIGQFLWGLSRNGTIHLPFLNPDGSRGYLEARIKDYVIDMQRVYDIGISQKQDTNQPLIDAVIL